jgi:hypothetical protein
VYLPSLSEIEKGFSRLESSGRNTEHHDLLTVKQFLTYPIIQLEWHPLSPNHLFILNSKRLDLYNFGKESKQWELWIDSQNSISFCFGGGEGWSLFSVLLVKRSGELYCACPIIPFGTALSPAQFEKICSYKSANSLSEKNLKWIISDFSFDEYSGSYLYLPKSIPPNLKVQKLSCSTSKITLPSMSQAIRLFSTPYTHHFLHCMVIYDTGYIDVFVAESGVEPSWGLIRSTSSIHDEYSVRMLNVHRYEISEWRLVPKNYAYVDIIMHLSEIDGFLLRYGPHVYAVQLLEILNALLGLDDIPEGREPDDSMQTLFGMSWNSSLVTFSDACQNDIDISGGVQFIEIGLDRKILAVSPDFKFLCIATSSVNGLRSEKFDPEIEKLKLSVDLSAIENLAPSSSSVTITKIKKLKTELANLMSSIKNSSAENDPIIARRLRDIILDTEKLLDEPEMVHLHDAFFELENLSRCSLRMESDLVRSIQYSEQDQEIAKQLEDISLDLPHSSKSLAIVGHFAHSD